MLDKLSANLSSHNISKTISKKTYSIAVEFLDNLLKHTKYPKDTKILDIYEPKFIVSLYKDKINIQAGNIIEKECIEILQSKIAKINAIDKHKIKEEYIKNVAAAKITDKGGAGLGLFKIAKTANNNINFEFYKINNKYYYYISEIIIHQNNEKMRKLFIEKTSKTPKIVFDPDNWFFEMEGISRPENVREFYYPIIEALENFKKNEIKTIPPDKLKTPFVVKFYLDYFNSSSAKFILDIILQISGFHDGGLSPVIEWYFEEDDVDMKEAGEEFEELMDMEFKYIMIKD